MGLCGSGFEIGKKLLNSEVPTSCIYIFVFKIIKMYIILVEIDRGID